MFYLFPVYYLVIKQTHVSNVTFCQIQVIMEQVGVYSNWLKEV